MNVRLLLSAMLWVLLLSGCRRDPYTRIYIENMNAEKRLLEDTLYELQYDYETKVAEVERLRERLEELKSGGAGATETGNSNERSRGREPRDLFPRIPDLKPPTVESGGEGETESQGEESEPGSGPNEQSKPQPEDESPVPPKLELDGSPAPAGDEAQSPRRNTNTGNRDIGRSPRGRVAGRWTPRTERLSTPSSRRPVNVAEGPRRPDSPRTTRARAQQNGWESTGRTQTAAPPGTREAHLPQWRPYR